MSDQTFASPDDPYWLSSRGVSSVHFLKQDNPPLAYADGRGALYELTDGILYFNGVPVSGGGSGDVSSSTDPSVDNALVRFDSTTGKIIQEGNIILEDGSGDNVVLSGRPSASNLPLMLCTDTTQKTALGLRIPQDSSLGIGSTAIGSSAMEATSAAQYCTAVGANALFQCDGDGNVAIGVDSALNYTGTESNNICIDSRGVLGDNDTIRIGDTHTDCFIQGIRGSTPALVSPEMVIVDSAGKLSSQAIPSGGLTLAGASSDTGSMVLYAGVPGEVAAGNLSLNTVGNQITFTDSVSGNFLKTTANESVYLGVSAGNGFAGTVNTAIGGSAMSSHNGGSSNTAVGGFSLSAKTTASGNTIYGASAAQNLLTGNSNVVIGASAGSAYTTNESNNIVVANPGVIADSAVIRIGSDTQTSCFIAREFKSNGTTLKIGNQAGIGLLDSNSTSRCTLVGNQTGISLVAQTDVTAVGDKAARYCTGSSTTCVGGGSLAGVSATGSNNAILGFNCMPASTSGQGNVICGTNGGLVITTASTNTLLGNSVAPLLSTGSSNICIGATSGGVLTTGSNNILIAANAPSATSAGAIVIGSATQTNTTIAEDFRSNASITRVGYRAGNVATTSATNTCLVGNNAGLAITSATGNTLVGASAGAGLTGAVNTVVGAQSLDVAGAMANNTVVGAVSARTCTSNDNVIIGHAAAQQLTTSPNNIIIGKNAGLTLATGTGGGVYIAASAALATEAGTIRIGTAATQTRAFISGISGVTTGGAAVACLVDANGQLGTVSSSRLVKENIRDIEDTSFLHQLEIKNFEYINGTVLSEDPESPDYNKKQKQVGVIAEDVELIKPELVIMQGNGIKTVDYNALYICALKELQILSARVASLVDRVASLEAIAALP